MSRIIATRWPTAWHFYVPDPPDEPGADAHEADPPDRARWVLALGIVSLLIGPLGIYAWMAGNSCIQAIAEGRMDPTCESNARAGRLLGVIALCMCTIKVTVLLPLTAYLVWFV